MAILCPSGSRTDITIKGTSLAHSSFSRTSAMNQPLQSGSLMSSTIESGLSSNRYLTASAPLLKTFTSCPFLLRHMSMVFARIELSSTIRTFFPIVDSYQNSLLIPVASGLRLSLRLRDQFVQYQVEKRAHAGNKENRQSPYSPHASQEPLSLEQMPHCYRNQSPVHQSYQN